MGLQKVGDWFENMSPSGQLVLVNPMLPEGSVKISFLLFALCC